MLRGGVPHRHEQNESRIDCGFYGSKQKAIGSNTGKTGTSRCCYENYAPDNGRNGQEFSNLQSLKEITRGELEKEVAKIENGTLGILILSV